MECCFCGHQWSLMDVARGVKNKCNCSMEQVKEDFVLFCDMYKHFKSFRVCTACEEFDTCRTREDAEIKHMLSKERPVLKRRPKEVD